jgi:hypothetical protein
MENSMGAPQNIKNRAVVWYSNTTPRDVPERI